MPLVLTEDWRHGAVDTETNSRLVIKSTPQIDFLIAEFSCPTAKLNIGLIKQLKFPDRPLGENGTPNPGLMISVPGLDGSLLSGNMIDVEENTKLLNQIIRMIGFINRHYPLSRSPFLWSDAPMYPPRLFRMPLDAELLELSSQT
jgi:hypothetical protein